MMPSVDLGSLAKSRLRDYLLRFAFGGAITAAIGIVTRAYGPAIGGLFLAFPAILPASLTLVQQHQGRRAAADEARGAILGAMALLIFAAVTLWLAPFGAALALGAATCAWGITSAALWALCFAWRPR